MPTQGVRAAKLVDVSSPHATPSTIAIDCTVESEAIAPTPATFTRLRTSTSNAFAGAPIRIAKFTAVVTYTPAM